MREDHMKSNEEYSGFSGEILIGVFIFTALILAMSTWFI